MEFGKVAVLMGGTSNEREVSLISGKRVIEALRKKNIDAHGVDAKGDYISVLQHGNFDRVFNALHGGIGENGVISGLLEALGLPYTGSGVLGSSIAMDKIMAKQIFMANGVPTPKAHLIKNESELKFLDMMQYPLVTKPVAEGSTFGVCKVTKLEELVESYRRSAQYGPVMVEEWVEGKELTVGILANKALPPVEIVLPGEMYTYENKYQEDETKYLCPTTLTIAEEQAIQEIALRAFRVLGTEYWGRVDFKQDENGNFWVLEVNTTPGLTDHSLVPQSAAFLGMSFEDVIENILMQTMKVETKVEAEIS